MDPQVHLYHACADGDEDAALQALAAGADVNRPCGPAEGNALLPLFIAIQEHHVELMRRLVEPPISAEVNLCYDNGWCTAFLYECWHGILEAVELLLAAGADPTVTTTTDKLSALHLASDGDLLRFLLQLGLPLELRSELEVPPLQDACHRGHLDCVKALLAAGADIHATDNEGWGMLHFSAVEGTAELIQLMLNCGKASSCPLDPNARNDDGETPLVVAACHTNPDATRALLAAGADVGDTDGQGRTALHRMWGQTASAVRRAWKNS